MRLLNQIQEMNLKYSNSKEIFKSGILGFFIGLAVIIPGVSASTLAIIFMMYEKILYSIGNITKRPKDSLLFLAPIILGAMIGFIIGFFIIQKLIQIIPFTLTALFGGLMLGSIREIHHKIENEKTTKKAILLFIAGISIPLIISSISIFTNTQQKTLEAVSIFHYIFFFMLGMLVSLTQIIPGLSATALLMSIGYFKPLLEAVNLNYLSQNWNIFILILTMVIGFCLGLVFFSRLFTQILAKYENKTYFIIYGLSIGSIITMFYNLDIILIYQNWFSNGFSFDFYLGIPLFLVGFIGGNRLSKKELIE